MAYAQDFVSYLLMEKYMENYEVRNIILYGSVVRGDFTKNSDVDIFIDVDTDENLKDLVKTTTTNFYGSLWFKKWERLGIRNTISCLSGRLDEWKDLERSMISNGKVLYGNYRPETKTGKLVGLFYVESVKPESKRVFINRKLFGYKRYGKKYAGLVRRHDGEKVGRGCFLVPMEFTQQILQFFRQNKVKATVREIALL